MKIKLTLVGVLFICAISSQAQTVFSQHIDFSDKQQTHVLHTNNGDQYIGQIIVVQNNTIAFKIRNLENSIHLPFSAVSFVGILGEDLISYQEELRSTPKQIKKEAIPMPSNQLTYSATALPYRGKGVYRNTMLFVNQIEKQTSQHFGYSITYVLPFIFSAKIQGKFPINEFVHISIVAQEHVLSVDPVFVTHPYGVVTVGDYEKYLNLTFGYWIDSRPLRFSGDKQVISSTFSLGGSFTFDNGWRFYTETMLIIEKQDHFIFPSFNLSHYKDRRMFEIGLIALPDTGVPLLPILSYFRAF